MKRCKIAFRLVRDEDGYPPFAIETVWAKETELNNQYEIDSIPFFAQQATFGDVVIANGDTPPVVFTRVVRRSRNSLIRVVFHDAALMPTVRADLEALGCSMESFVERSLLAVNIPGAVSLELVQKYLTRMTERDLIGYEEPILRQ